MSKNGKKPLLKLKNVSKSYGREQILNSVSFSIGQGEIVGLVGPNGAGKSTIMKITSGLTKKYEGKVYLNGTEIENVKSHKRLIGCLIESPGVYPDDTGLKNLQFCGRLSGDYSLEQIYDLAERLDISYALKKRVGNYSLGMKQKLGICMSLIGNPQMLILDEPTNGLDPSAIPAVRDIIRYYAKEKNVGVLISSHILSEIEAICDDVIFIKKGTIVQQENLHDNVDEGYIFESDNPEVLMQCLRNKGYNAWSMDSKVVSDIKENDIGEFLSFALSRNVTIKGMYKKQEKLEEKYHKIVGNK